MQYVAIDIETTGLESEWDQVLHVALVHEDTTRAEAWEVNELPYFEALIYHERIEGDAYALNMNHEIIEAFADFKPTEASAELRGRVVPVYGDLDSVLDEAKIWLANCHEHDGPYVAAGKNVAGFDLQFLGRAWRELFHDRVIDVGSLALGSQPFRWQHDKVPSLAELNVNNPCPHDALYDARSVVDILRTIGGYL